MRKYYLLFFMFIFSNSVFAESSKITIKDFYLGMPVQEVASLIKQLKLVKGAGFNKCTSKKNKYRVSPLSAFEDRSHLYDQECYLFPYDLLKSEVEVKVAFHDSKLFFAKFITIGNLSFGENKALINALENKYGKPKKFRFNSFLGSSEGRKWVLGDVEILLGYSELILQSKKGLKEMSRRDKERSKKIGAEL